jgi:polyisoprenoid-binding protein YceI
MTEQKTIKEMKKIVILFFLGISSTAWAQKFAAESSYVLFYSHAAIEDIKAENKKSSSMFNTSTGDVVFAIPNQDFQFQKSLMQEHFNEKYMETEKYPRATFQGKISGFDEKATGTQNATAKGKMTIHGVTRDVEIPGTMEMVDNKITLKSKFIIVLVDYKVQRPQLLWKNIAEQVEVTIEFTYKPI